MLSCSDLRHVYARTSKCRNRLPSSLLIRVSLVRSQRGPPIESTTYRDLGATVADGCHHCVTGPQTRRSLHSPAEDAFPTGCFVISRSAVRVRSPAPIESITYRDSRDRRLRLCRHYVEANPPHRAARSSAARQHRERLRRTPRWAALAPGVNNSSSIAVRCRRAAAVAGKVSGLRGRCARPSRHRRFGFARPIAVQLVARIRGAKR